MNWNPAGIRYENLAITLKNNGIVHDIQPNGLDDFMAKNVAIACEGTCQFIQDNTAVGNYYFENFIVGSSTFWNGNTFDNCGVSTPCANVVLKNTTTTDLVQTGALFYNYQTATITLKDQNDVLINGNAHLRTTKGRASSFGVMPQQNPTTDIDIAVVNGIGRTFILQNTTYMGTEYVVISSYNITAKSRGKSESKIVNFASPAQETFSFDFTSEDAGQNVIVDNRTFTEKVGNDVSGTVIPIVAVIASLLLPFLAILR